MCGRGHHHHHRRHGRRGRRVPNREELINQLEERQRDLEQEIADLADVLKHLKTETPEGATAL